MQVGKRTGRSPGWADLHARTGDRVQHPGRHHHDSARRYFDMNHPITGPALTVVTAQPAPVKRVPSAVDDDILPDMGRMTQAWPCRANLPQLCRMSASAVEWALLNEKL